MASRVGLEAEPVEVLEDGRLVLGTAADAIVVLDAQQHAPARRPRHAPHADGVHDVAEVQVPCR